MYWGAGVNVLGDGGFRRCCRCRRCCCLFFFAFPFFTFRAAFSLPFQLTDTWLVGQSTSFVNFNSNGNIRAHTGNTRKPRNARKNNISYGRGSLATANCHTLTNLCFDLKTRWTKKMHKFRQKNWQHMNSQSPTSRSPTFFILPGHCLDLSFSLVVRKSSLWRHCNSSN